jgi:dTDP-4-amino-4,6-dideoxygalactose transaminase
MNQPILLSTPHIGDRELEFVKQAFDTNWIAPVGPNTVQLRILVAFAFSVETRHGASLQYGRTKGFGLI